MQKEYKNDKLEELPDVLEVKHVQNILNISKAKAYQLVSRNEFPAKRIGDGRLIRIPKQKFIQWLNDVDL